MHGSISLFVTWKPNASHFPNVPNEITFTTSFREPFIVKRLLKFVRDGALQPALSSLEKTKKNARTQQFRRFVGAKVQGLIP